MVVLIALVNLSSLYVTIIPGVVSSVSTGAGTDLAFASSFTSAVAVLVLYYKYNKCLTAV